MAKVTKDERSISCIVIDYNQRVHDWNPTVGRDGVTTIEAYEETGQMAYVPWFAIRVGGEVVWRVNGHYVVEVSYAK
jgi:hypothetical protein